MNRHPRLRLVLSGLAVSLLAACGGGGGGDGGGNDSPPAARVAITSNNAPTVTAQAVAAGSFGFVGDALGTTGVQISTSVRPASLNGAMRSAFGVARRVERPASAVVGATFSETVPCTVSGTVKISADVASEAGLRAGDSLVLDFTACVEDDTQLDGRLSMALTLVEQDELLIEATATARAFQATAGGVTERMDGALRIRLDDTDGLTSRIALASDRLDFDRIVGGAVTVSRVLYDYDYVSVLTLSTGSTSEGLSFVASGNFGSLGTVSFAVTTVEDLVTPDGALRPTAGVFRVTGANSTSVLVSIGGAGVLVLDIDTDGNGEADDTVQLTWEELDAEL